MVEVILVLPLSLDVHIACIPVPVFWHALRRPVRPDSELGVLIPFGGFVFEERIPGWLERAASRKIRDGRFERNVVPHASGGWRRRWVVIPLRRLPCCFVQFHRDDS